jgi:hypothetical protein
LHAGRAAFTSGLNVTGIVTVVTFATLAVLVPVMRPATVTGDASPEPVGSGPRGDTPVLERRQVLPAHDCPEQTVAIGCQEAALGSDHVTAPAGADHREEGS